MVPIIASHRRRLLQFLVVPLLPHLHEFFFQFLEQNMYWHIVPLQSARIFLSNESSFTKTDSEQESYVHCIPALQYVSTNLRTRNVQCSCHISLYGSSNSLILDVLEREFHGASEYQLFLPCTSLSMCKIWWKQRGLLSNFGDVDEFDFFFDHEFMGTLCHACKIIQVHNLPPRWQLGVETIANKPKTSPKILNLWHN